ncbi:MAG TPA: VCBS repeat-containing protein [Opitutaceae bacterium]|nr:VCBS repeat-containing protein [Opitutaceae bacterium]
MARCPRLVSDGVALGALIFASCTSLVFAAAEPGETKVVAAPEGLTVSPLMRRTSAGGKTLFSELPPEKTGIQSDNRYEDPSMWRERFADFEAGSVGTGVAIGDYDGDGRPDIFIVNKTESCRLFRNLGDWKFEDVTEAAGLGGDGAAAAVWKSGATFVDVNNDGRLDLYVCRFGAPNLLYVNQGDGTFREEGALRGLAVNDASVMAAFCDYDRDGALDVYVQTNQPDSAGHVYPKRNYLFHNDGKGNFVEVSAAAGVLVAGQGHSAMWWDFNNDGWPDLYVGNDFTPRDKLFRNNRDGTFTEVIDQVVPRMPFSSMGSDVGDVDNDGRLDLFVADMAATTHEKDQRTMANARRLLPPATLRADQAQNVMRNVLYLNSGKGRCLEVAALAGLDATDWTWATRFEDFDNDGRVDLFVTNGMYREPHNADLMDRVAKAETIDEKIRLVRASPTLAEQHRAYRNLGGLKFRDVSSDWGLAQTAVSFGAATGDLDGDGDLDLVWTNFRKGPTVMRNDSSSGHSVLIQLRGTASNSFGIGARVTLESASGKQVRELILERGYLSSSEPVLHFGLGEDSKIRRLSVSWPSGYVQNFENLGVDVRMTITEPKTRKSPSPNESDAQPAFGAMFSEETKKFRDSSAVRAVMPQGPSNASVLSLPLNLRPETHTKAALQLDLDRNGVTDVIAAPEWGSVQFFRRGAAGAFKREDVRGFETAGRGWWNAIAAGDFNRDGRPDFALGNAGLNTPYRADERHPAIVLIGDFRGDGGAENVEAYYERDRLYPRASRKELAEAVPAILKRFPRNDLYARATLSEILGEQNVAKAKRLEATQLASGVLLSQPDGAYRFEAFPWRAQVAPIEFLVVADFDGDGNSDIFATQNGAAPEPLTQSFGGGLGQLLLGDGRGNFRAVPVSESNLSVPDEVDALAAVDVDGDGKLDIVAHRASGGALVFRNRCGEGKSSSRHP